MATESFQSFVSNHLVNVLVLQKILVEFEVIVGSIRACGRHEEVRDVELDVESSKSSEDILSFL